MTIVQRWIAINDWWLSRYALHQRSMMWCFGTADAQRGCTPHKICWYLRQVACDMAHCEGWSLAYDCGIKSQLLRLNTNHGVLLTLYSFEDLGEHMMVAHIRTFPNIEFEKKHPGMERPNVESTPYISTTTDWWLKLRPIPPPECKDFAEQVMASLSALSISLKNLPIPSHPIPHIALSVQYHLIMI